jgi:hypothetical protein
LENREKKDMSNPKSYRCISLLNNVAKLTDKGVVQYLTLEGEVHGWWHPYQFGSRPGRNSTDALMWVEAVVKKNRNENMNTALIMTDVATAVPGTRPSTSITAPGLSPSHHRNSFNAIRTSCLMLSRRDSKCTDYHLIQESLKLR